MKRALFFSALALALVLGCPRSEDAFVPVAATQPIVPATTNTHSTPTSASQAAAVPGSAPHQSPESCLPDDFLRAPGVANVEPRMLLTFLYDGEVGGHYRESKETIELFQKACDAGNKECCIERDYYKACAAGGTAESCSMFAKFYKEKCDAGRKESCSRLGLLYEFGYWGPAKDPQKAAALYQKACDDGSDTSCRRLSDLYEDECQDGSTESCTRFGALHQKLCDAGNNNECYYLALDYEKGAVVPKDPKKAAGLYMKACSAGDIRACKKRCTAGEKQACKLQKEWEELYDLGL